MLSDERGAFYGPDQAAVAKPWANLHDREGRALNLDGVAVALGTSKRHVQRLVAERRIAFVKVGRFVRFDPAAVDAWIDAQRIAPVPRRTRYETIGR